MNTFTRITRAVGVSLVVLTLTGQAWSATDPLEQVKRDCFRAHQQIMDKPALRTIDTCWRVHGYLMKK